MVKRLLYRHFPVFARHLATFAHSTMFALSPPYPMPSRPQDLAITLPSYTCARLGTRNSWDIYPALVGYLRVTLPTHQPDLPTPNSFP